ncbi:MAG: hypothetical protein JSU91_05805 [Thermoplasmatales archaeon]|nr:MAG: hypothetical protein JSU91_05805 [Thermoplasmatales archaeon]
MKKKLRKKERNKQNSRTKAIDKKTMLKKADEFFDIAKIVIKGLTIDGYLTYGQEKELMQELERQTPLLHKQVERRFTNQDEEDDLIKYIFSYDCPGELTMEEMAHEIFTFGRPFGKTFEELGYNEAWVYCIIDEAVGAILDDVKSGKMSWKELERRAKKSKD